MAPKKTQMSPNARKVLDYLKTQYEEGNRNDETGHCG